MKKLNLRRLLVTQGLLVALLNPVLSQTDPSFQNLINVSTVSPEAANLGKFGNIPVGYATGIPSITIPVFEVNAGKIKLPLSLDYHAGGIRVDEVASSVGLGWALNGVGMVSRNSIGIPDDQSGGLNYYYPSYDSVYRFQQRIQTYGATADGRFTDYITNVSKGLNDEDPDMYSYSLAGESGKFLFQPDGSIFQVPRSNNIIAKSGPDYTITDQNGVVYLFNQEEHTYNVNGQTTPTFISSWRLTKMIDADGVDTIFFHYQAACSVNLETYHNYTYTLGNGPNCSAPNTNGTSYFSESSSSSTIEHTDETFLQSITWRGGKILFVDTCDRADKSSEQRLQEVDVYASLKGGYTLVKKVKLYQSYFSFNSTSGNTAYISSDERNFRLKLDSVAYIAVNTTDQPELYRMTYNSTNLPSRETFAQDQWGFSNGHYSNSTPMPVQTVAYHGGNYTFGEANRDPDSASMLAGTLTSLQYPTGGKSVFELEPHKHLSNISVVTYPSVSTTATGNVQSSSSFIFTPDSLGSSYLITYFFSSYNYAGVSNRPSITIVDQTTGSQVVFISSNIDPTQSVGNSASPLTFGPVLGHTYLVTVNIYTTTEAAVNAWVTISWTRTNPNVPNILPGGGLRVKSITSYDYNGHFIDKQLYKYGVNESGLGNILTADQYLQVNYENVNYWCGNSSDEGCVEYVSDNQLVVYHANGIYPATQFSGSPIVYTAVAKYEVDSSGNATNGKSVFQYYEFDDYPAFAISDYGTMGIMLVTNSWRNGILAEQDDYVYNPGTASYSLLHSKVNNYVASRLDTLISLKLKTQWIYTGGCYNETDSNNARSAFQSYLVPTVSGAMLLQSTSDTTWDTNGNRLASTVNYTYGDTTHLLATRKLTINSKADTLTENYKYPHDFTAAGNVYQKMMTRNIIAPTVQVQSLYNSQQTGLTNVNYYDWSGSSTLLLPQTIDHQTGSFPIENRLQFNQFDRYGNILQQQKANDVYQAYIWDYNSLYPIADIKNGDSASVAFTSFEADGTGNWTISALKLGTTGGLTGNNFDTLATGATISHSGLNAARTYLVTYWSKNGAATISGSMVTTGLVKKGWTFYQHALAASSASVSITGSGIILDELRLYPTDAQMNTYTYTPLVGMTSSCSASNLTTYYEYDGLNRLLRIRDMDGNIIKQYSYQYQILNTMAP